MAERRTRYNELLGLPNHIRDPDLYQLLGLDRTAFADAQVEPAYREHMSKLQAIRSPKHKSFIEFLKGELRRARTTLSDARKRAEYDQEMLDERRGQLTMILDVVLADGVLAPLEEERIHRVAQDVGLLADEVAQLLEEELRARGARRGTGSDEAAIAPTPAAPPAAAPPGGPGGFFGGGAPPAPRPAASPQHIQQAIQRNMGRPAPPQPPASPPPPQRPAAPPPAPAPAPSGRSGDEIVAELLGGLAPPAPPQQQAAPPPAAPPRAAPPSPGWGQQPPAAAPAGQQQPRPKKRASSGWGQAAVARTHVCSGCLAQVTDNQILGRKAERLADGRIHCPRCREQLVAGIICAVCYQRVTRAEMKQGRVVVRERRAYHQTCL